MHSTDIAIIGAGPIGLFTIFQAGMIGATCHVIDSLEEIGGQCKALYPEKPIYDIPAYPKISGADLIDKLYMQAAPFMPVFHLNQQVTSISRCNDNDFIVITSKETKVKAKAVIIAAGCGAFGPNRPPLANIEKYENQTIFYNVTNKELFRNKILIIAGGGDSAVDWAIELTGLAKKIYLVHRRAKFRAAPLSQQKLQELANSGKVELVIGYQLKSILSHNEEFMGINVENLDGDNKALIADYLLPFYGLSQHLGPIANWELNLSNNHIKADLPHFTTNVEGVYAIGDIASYEGKLKLILTGFAESAAAVHHVYSRIFDGKALHFEYSTNKGINGFAE